MSVEIGSDGSVYVFPDDVRPASVNRPGMMRRACAERLPSVMSGGPPRACVLEEGHAGEHTSAWDRGYVSVRRERAHRDAPVSGVVLGAEYVAVYGGVPIRLRRAEDVDAVIAALRDARNAAWPQ